MAHVTIPDEENYVLFSAPESAGPFSFGFVVFQKADLRVWVGGEELSQSGFSATLNAGTEGGFDGGSITLVDSASGAEDVLILRDVRPARTTDFASGAITPQNFNDAFDFLTGAIADVRYLALRAPRLPLGETASLKIFGTNEDGESVLLDQSDFAGGGGGGGGGLASLADDPSPQLSADLDLNGNQVTGLVIGTDVQAWSAALDATEEAFTEDLKIKLDGIEEGARGDQTGAEIATLLFDEDDQNIFTDALRAKLVDIDPAAFFNKTGGTLTGTTTLRYGSGGLGVFIANGNVVLRPRNNEDTAWDVERDFTYYSGLRKWTVEGPLDVESLEIGGTAFDPADKQDVSEKGAANGYASLDAGGRVPAAELPESVTAGQSYQGTWNADTDTPTIPAAAGGNAGHYYIVSVAGTTTIDGISSWSVGDRIQSNGSEWEKIPNVVPVSSVAGKTGAVTLVKGDVGLGNVDNTADSAKPVSTAQQTALDAKQNLSAKGEANGYAPLDANSKVPAANLPTLADSVDDSTALIDISGDPDNVIFVKDQHRIFFFDELAELEDDNQLSVTPTGESGAGRWRPLGSGRVQKIYPAGTALEQKNRVQKVINELERLGGGEIYLLPGEHEWDTSGGYIEVNTENANIPITIRGAGASTIIKITSGGKAFKLGSNTPGSAKLCREFACYDVLFQCEGNVARPIGTDPEDMHDLDAIFWAAWCVNSFFSRIWVEHIHCFIKTASIGDPTVVKSGSRLHVDNILGSVNFFQDNSCGRFFVIGRSFGLRVEQCNISLAGQSEEEAPDVAEDGYVFEYPPGAGNDTILVENCTFLRLAGGVRVLGSATPGNNTDTQLANAWFTGVVWDRMWNHSFLVDFPVGGSNSVRRVHFNHNWLISSSDAGAPSNNHIVFVNSNQTPVNDCSINAIEFNDCHFVNSNGDGANISRRVYSVSFRDCEFYRSIGNSSGDRIIRSGADVTVVDGCALGVPHNRADVSGNYNTCVEIIAQNVDYRVENNDFEGYKGDPYVFPAHTNKAIGRVVEGNRFSPGSGGNLPNSVCYQNVPMTGSGMTIDAHPVYDTELWVADGSNVVISGTNLGSGGSGRYRIPAGGTATVTYISAPKIGRTPWDLGASLDETFNTDGRMATGNWEGGALTQIRVDGRLLPIKPNPAPFGPTTTLQFGWGGAGQTNMPAFCPMFTSA